jgi:hypothetical protein
MTSKLPLGFAAFALAMAASPFALAQNETSPTSTVSAGGSATSTTGTAPTSATPAGAEPKKDEATKEAAPEEKKEEKLNPFRGSIFLFDQSILTSNLSKGGQLSPSPEYEWWISPRIYYSFDKHIKVGARFDFFKEMVTNHEETTDAREWRYGDPWITASYSDKATFLSPKSRWAVGLVARPPMSKESRANGQFFALGPNASLTYGIDLNKGSKWFSGMSIGASVSYSHAFTKSTTPDSFTSFQRPHTDANGDGYMDSQVRSSTLTGNTLLYALNAEIEIHDDISFSGSMIWIDQFAYQPPDATFNGQTVARNPNDTHFRQLTWFLLDLDYQVIPELSLSLGYYNLNSSIALDGSRRNFLWSPESRLFFSMTANLDALYDDATKTGKKPSASAKTNPLGMF